MSCRRTSRSRGRRRSRPRWALRLTEPPAKLARGQTARPLPMQRCPPAKPAAFPSPPTLPRRPSSQGPSQLLWLRCHRSSFGQGRRASKTGRS